MDEQTLARFAAEVIGVLQETRANPDVTAEIALGVLDDLADKTGHLPR